jgi:hypothetical protein
MGDLHPIRLRPCPAYTKSGGSGYFVLFLKANHFTSVSAIWKDGSPKPAKKEAGDDHGDRDITEI